jgi:hypothetical protein
MNPRAAVRPAAWAALGESGVVYLPVKLLLEQATRGHTGPLIWFPSFVLLYVAGTVLVTRFRDSRSTPSVVAGVGLGVGLTQGALWGIHGPAEVGTALAVSAAVALRVVTLGLRDWRNPIHGSFGWGAGILLFEVVFGGSIGTTWRAPLPVVVALFFAGSLASRAASVRLTAPPEARIGESEGADDEARAKTVGDRLTLLAVAALAAALALVGILTAGGGLELLGNLIYPVLVFVVSVAAFLMSQIARPLLWLVDKLPIDLGGIVEFLHRLRDGRTRPLPNQPPPNGGGLIPRLLGLVVVAAIVWVMVQVIRRRRAEDDWGSEHRDEPAPPARPLRPAQRLRAARRARRELPADTVRRWYAEALLLLERKGVARAPGQTPDEFLRQVAAAVPECRHGFHELTRAYEQVRYGNVIFGRDDLKVLEPRQAHVMEVLQRARPVEMAEDDQP